MEEEYVYSDEEYGKILDNFVIACVDVAVIHGNSILLEKRIQEPIKNRWWIFGGRVKKGEDLLFAAQRGILRELGVNIQDASRMKEIGTYNLIWPVRREPVSSNGCHHLLIAHGVEVNDAEAQTIDLYINGRQDVRWMNIFNIQDELLPEMDSIIARTISTFNLTSNS